MRGTVTWHVTAVCTWGLLLVCIPHTSGEPSRSISNNSITSSVLPHNVTTSLTTSPHQTTALTDVTEVPPSPTTLYREFHTTKHHAGHQNSTTPVKDGKERVKQHEERFASHREPMVKLFLEADIITYSKPESAAYGWTDSRSNQPRVENSNPTPRASRAKNPASAPLLFTTKYSGVNNFNTERINSLPDGSVSQSISLANLKLLTKRQVPANEAETGSKSGQGDSARDRVNAKMNPLKSRAKKKSYASLKMMSQEEAGPYFARQTKKNSKESNKSHSTVDRKDTNVSSRNSEDGNQNASQGNSSKYGSQPTRVRSRDGQRSRSSSFRAGAPSGLVGVIAQGSGTISRTDESGQTRTRTPYARQDGEAFSRGNNSRSFEHKESGSDTDQNSFMGRIKPDSTRLRPDPDDPSTWVKSDEDAFGSTKKAGSSGSSLSQAAIVGIILCSFVVLGLVVAIIIWCK